MRQVFGLELSPQLTTPNEDTRGGDALASRDTRQRASLLRVGIQDQTGSSMTLKSPRSYNKYGQII
jgi:hypothetical protein